MDVVMAYYCFNVKQFERVWDMSLTLSIELGILALLYNLIYGARIMRT